MHYFLKEGVWHIYNLNAPEALCDEVRLIYGVDPVTDIIPTGGVVHDACLAAADGTPPAEKPKGSLATRQTKRKAKSK